MDIQDRQHIGILASIDEAGGRDTVFINKGSYIQYRVKSLLLPQESPNFMSGFISSFEDDSEINDDEYSSEEERINNFEEAVKDKLFVYSYRVNGEGHANLGNGKTNLVKRPEKVTRDTYFYAVPVFSSKNNDTSREWELERKWSLFREYESKEEFIQFLKNKKSVGSTYGYYPDAFTPSFVIWLNDDGTMYAIGHVIENRYNMQGGLIIECDKIAIVNIDEFDEFWVYQASLNPTLMYIPENIYAKVEDKLSKAISVEKNGENVETDLQDSTDKKESTSVSTQNIKQEEQLIEIDVSEKTDDLIIKSMDYHSQKRNLFYNMKDFVNIHTALKCSSLVILSGLSGTGKSAIVDIYARALGINNTANPDENRLLFIPVRPSWNDDSDLLGYVDLVHMVYRASDSGFVDFLVRAQKEENKNKLFIVCFDEMNLARVEHYFSQFLSLLERPANQRELQLYDKQYSGRLYNSAEYPNRIKISDNVKFIGTVNIDESTYHFSDKVLDRANVIQLDVLNYASMWKKTKYGSLVNVNWTMDDYNAITVTNSDEDMQLVHQLLWDIHNLLHSANSKYGVGPRIVKSIEMYLWNLPKSGIGNFSYSDGIDLQIAQRVLTKVRGPENQLGEILDEKSENNIHLIFDKYHDLSEFSICRDIVQQKQKELESYGYCI
ncbi:MAG: McrB family protein [Oliverpabstia sp.]